MTHHKINVTTSQHGDHWHAVASYAGQLVPVGMTTELAPRDTERDAFMDAVAYLYDATAAKADAADRAKLSMDERARRGVPESVAHTLEARREYGAMAGDGMGI